MSFPQDNFKFKSISMKQNQKQNGHYSKHAHNSEENFLFKANDRKNLKEPGNRITFTVMGNRVSKEFIYCMYMTINLHRYAPKQFKVPVIKGVYNLKKIEELFYCYQAWKHRIERIIGCLQLFVCLRFLNIIGI